MNRHDPAAARERLQAAVGDLQSLSTDHSPDAGAVVAAATRALEAIEAWPGECQEATPYASLFLVLRVGKKFWRCTHEPPKGPHEVPA